MVNSCVFVYHVGKKHRKKFGQNLGIILEKNVRYSRLFPYKNETILFPTFVGRAWKELQSFSNHCGRQGIFFLLELGIRNKTAPKKE